MADRTASNYTIGSGDAQVNLPASAYYPKQATPMDVASHPSMSPNMRVNYAFDALMEGNFDKKKKEMDDSGR